MVAGVRLELTTTRVWTESSSQLRYPAINGREDRIWTCDPLVPNQVLYQAKLLPVIILISWCHINNIGALPGSWTLVRVNATQCVGGACQIWTDAYEGCSFMPYHLAKAPYLAFQNKKNRIFIFNETSIILQYF